MPTYEYECTRCALVTEEFTPMSAPRRRRCPACRGKVEIIISGGLGVVFKGTGFYINDSRSKTTDRSGSKNPEAKAKDTTTGPDSPAAAAAESSTPPATSQDSTPAGKNKS